MVQDTQYILFTFSNKKDSNLTKINKKDII